MMGSKRGQLKYFDAQGKITWRTGATSPSAKTHPKTCDALTDIRRNVRNGGRSSATPRATKNPQCALSVTFVNKTRIEQLVKLECVDVSFFLFLFCFWAPAWSPDKEFEHRRRATLSTFCVSCHLIFDGTGSCEAHQSRWIWSRSAGTTAG